MTSFRDVVASEWTKLWSVRSTAWSLVAAAATVIGVTVLSGRALLGYQPDVSSADVVGVALEGVTFGQLAVCVLAAMAITGEYGTGMIRNTLSTVPARSRLLLAKAAVVAAIALVTGVVGGLGSFLIARLVMGGPASEVSLADPGVWRALTGTGLYLAVLAVFALAVGTILRHSAATLATLIIGVLIMPVVLTQLGAAGKAVSRWWPSHAGFQLLHVDRLPGQLAPWAGFTVFTAATAVLLGLAALLLTRRDA
ncbi:ABC transporter permease [Actinoplanes sp. G11-F43]|uniref:ABC transporter permease n=1 Tax=Actinoplanes sp. G11-F43 TaxID=3424130 RepID=UPI003D342578